MTPDQLRHQLATLLADWEGECVEFKDANDNFPPTSASIFLRFVRSPTRHEINKGAQAMKIPILLIARGRFFDNYI